MQMVQSVCDGMQYGNAFVLQEDVPSKGHDRCQRLVPVSALIISLET